MGALLGEAEPLLAGQFLAGHIVNNRVAALRPRSFGAPDSPLGFFPTGFSQPSDVLACESGSEQALLDLGVVFRVHSLVSEGKKGLPR